jgi:hypothetical protein
VPCAAVLLPASFRTPAAAKLRADSLTRHAVILSVIVVAVIIIDTTTYSHQSPAAARIFFASSALRKQI